MPVALPMPVDPGSHAPNAKPGGPAQRPVAGPVVPLIATTVEREELIVEAQPVAADPAAVPAATPATATAPSKTTAKPAAAPAGARTATDAASTGQASTGQANGANPTAETKPPAQRRARTNSDAPRPPLSIQGLFR